MSQEALAEKFEEEDQKPEQQENQEQQQKKPHLHVVPNKEQKISDKEASDFKKQLVLNQNKESREQILGDIQNRIASVGKTDRNRHEELSKQDPERIHLRQTYEALL